MPELTPKVIDALVASGVTVEQLALAFKAVLADQEAKAAELRAKAAEKKRRQRARIQAADVDVCPGDSPPMSPDVPIRPGDIPPSLPLNDPQPSSLPFENNLNPNLSPLLSPISTQGWPKNAFEVFWKLYPRKAGKAAAERKFAVIRKQNKVSFETVMAGLQRYLDTDPDPEFIPHPTTWLNQGRWDDEIFVKPKTNGHAYHPPWLAPQVSTEQLLEWANSARENERAS